MSGTQKDLVNQFAANCAALRSQFFSDSAAVVRACAFSLTAAGLHTDPQTVRRCKALSVENSSCFDNIAEGMLPVLTYSLIVAADPDRRMHAIVEAYLRLRQDYIPSPFLIPAACVLSEETDKERMAALTARTHSLYSTMQLHHPLLTGLDDLAVCALIVFSGKEYLHTVEQLERCAHKLAEKTLFRNATQSLTHILAFCDDPTAACERMASISDALRACHLRLGSSWYTAAPGVLAYFSEEPALIAERVRLTDSILRKQEGFSVFVVPQQERRMYAALLTALALFQRSPTIPGVQNALRAAMLSVLAANTTDDLRGITDFRQPSSQS